MKIRIGIVGSGFIATEFIKNIAQLQNEIEVCSVYSRTKSKAIDFAKNNHINNVFDSFEELITSNTIDAVYIASHNDSHFDYAVKSLHLGLHVLCEKPAGVNYQELDTLINLAKEKKLIFMEAMRLLYMPTYLKVKEILYNKIFGEIISINVSLGRISSRGYRHTNILCGGALLDLGIYSLYALIDILGIPQDIKSAMLKNTAEVDKSCEAILVYPNYLASFQASFVSKTRGDLRIMCEKGTITLPAYFTESNKIILEDVQNDIEEVNFEIISSGMYYEIKCFANLVALNDITNSSYLHNQEIALQVVKSMDKIRKDNNVVYQGKE